jgi:hypothetical protein
MIPIVHGRLGRPARGSGNMGPRLICLPSGRETDSGRDGPTTRSTKLEKRTCGADLRVDAICYQSSTV